MTSILRAAENDAALLSEIARKSLVESHGNSAPAGDIDTYLANHCNTTAFVQELNETRNLYHIINYDNIPAGYSKIIFNSPYAGSPLENITKLERLYLLKPFYGLKLGLELLHFNIGLCKQADQKAIWLYVWKENARAVDFYLKSGFQIIGSYDFPISETHSNPNHQMLLQF
jgi:diamine N-acetyltransferase